MDQKTHDKGLEIRKAVLGEAYVSNALKNVDEFNAPASPATKSARS
jgi:4-carboxymuconolactone decarboxylase